MEFLKNIFGPSKDEIWGQLEQEIHATLINKDSLWHESKVVLEWDTLSKNEVKSP